MTDEDGEGGALRGRSKQLPRLSKLELGFLAYGDVVRTGSTLPATTRGTLLWCQRQDAQLAPRLGQFGGLPQRRLAGGSRLEYRENASGNPRGSRTGPPLARLVSGARGYVLSHVLRR